MNSANKLIAYLYTIILTALAGVLVTVMVGWQEPLQYLAQIVNDPNLRWGVGIGSLAVFVLGIYTLLSCIKTTPQKPQDAHIETTSLGAVSITIEAIENLVQKTGQGIVGVKEIRPVIKPVEEGVAIYVKVVVNPDVEIVQVTHDLQERIKEAVKKTAGVHVCEVKVLIDGIHREVRGRVE
ncbi:vacuolar-type H+-ATPase subunit F/Vma7 [Desulfitispora alkaliphila]|uniref:alkaline shock response membrane anchor protein AmaP n=1 Tax=Desulfitispora alkaliphila TaxID=622674 RepID=UPI003D1A5617